MIRISLTPWALAVLLMVGLGACSKPLVPAKPVTPKSSSTGAASSAAGKVQLPKGVLLGGRVAEEIGRAQTEVREFEFQFEPGHVLKGRVVFPEGTPDDELCSVVVMGRPDLGPGSASGGLDARWAPFHSSFEAARATVDVFSDGAFEIPVPSNSTGMYVEVRGRYLFGGITPLKGISLDRTHLKLEPTLGGWMSVKLVLPEGSAYLKSELVGKRLHLGHSGLMFARTLEPKMSGFIGKNLTADFLGLDTNVPYSINQIASDLGNFGVKRGEGLVPRSGEHLQADIHLVDGALFSGRVVDEDGAGIQGVELTVKTSALRRSPDRETTSGEDGQFVIMGVVNRVDSLEAELEGYLPLKWGPRLLGETVKHTGLELVLKRGKSIAGHVTFEDGQAAVGAAVYLSASKPDGRERRETRSDQDGYFRFGGLPGAPFDLSAYAPGSTEGVGMRVDARTIAAGEQQLHLVLHASPTLSVFVHDERGRPLQPYFLIGKGEQLSDGESMFRKLQRKRKGGVPPGRAITNAPRRELVRVTALDGRHVWKGLSPGEWTFWIEDERGTRSKAVKVVLSSEEVQLDFLLPQMGSIAGKVESGLVSGASVVDLTVRALRDVPGQSRVEVATVACAADGSFQLHELVAGSYHMEVNGRNFGSAGEQSVQILPGEDLEGFSLAVVHAGSLSCTVIGPDGEVVAGAWIEVQESTLGFSLSSITNESGQAQMGSLIPGLVSLRVSGPVEFTTTLEVHIGELRNVILRVPDP